MNVPLLVFLFIIFFLIIVSYAMQDLDFVAISFLGCFLAAAVTGFVMGLEFRDFISFIEFEAIIIILSMSIITKIAQDSNILEYIAIKLFKISRGDQRIFFYLLCIITTLLAAVISDLVVVLIMAPVVIRLCHFLKIRAGTYLLGMTICINIGSIITPFSSGENIIISTHFGLTTFFFIQYFWIFSFFLLFITIFLLDLLILRKEPKIDEQQKQLVLELINADIIIKNKKIFYFNSIVILLTIVFFVLLPMIYLTAAISSSILVLVNKKASDKKMKDILSEIDWEIIFFFIALYVIIGCLGEAGFNELFEAIPFEDFNFFLLCFIILILVSLISGIVANTPTALVFIPIISALINTYNFPAIPLIFAFIIGINIGGNIIPQGAACDMMTLKIAEDSEVKNFSYKRLLKNGFLFAFLHILLSMGYLLILIFICS